MKLLVLTNSKNTTPASFNSSTHFTALLNRVIKLPRFCQVCILSATVEDGNSPKLHYVALNNLPVTTNVANGEKGNQTKIVGAIISDVNDYRQNWVDLDNPAVITITDLDVSIVNQDNEESSGLTGSTEIILAYREDPMKIRRIS